MEGPYRRAFELTLDGRRQPIEDIVHRTVPPELSSNALTAAWQDRWSLAAAQHATPPWQSHHAFAGASVRIRSVGAELGCETARVFRHLEAPPVDQPTLCIDLWDEAVTGVPPPNEPPAAEQGTVIPIGSAELNVQGRGRCFSLRRGPDSMTWLDRACGTIVGWRRDAGRMSFVEHSKPFSLLLRTWYYDRNVDFVHAALVAKQGCGILVGGHTGAGKTTTALACLAAGFDCLGDDEVGLECREDEFVGHRLYDSLRLRSGSEAQLADRLREIPPARFDPESGKALYFLSELSPRPKETRTSIRAVVLPRIVDSGPCRIEPIPHRNALFRLGATSAFGPLGFGERAYGRLKRLVSSLPTYELQLGHDWATVPTCLDSVLTELGTR